MKLDTTAHSMNIVTSFAIGEVVYRLYNGEITKGYISKIDLTVELNNSRKPDSQVKLMELLIFCSEERGETIAMFRDKGSILRTKKEAARQMLKEAGLECGLEDLDD